MKCVPKVLIERVAVYFSEMLVFKLKSHCKELKFCISKHIQYPRRYQEICRLSFGSEANYRGRGNNERKVTFILNIPIYTIHIWKPESKDHNWAPKQGRCCSRRPFLFSYENPESCTFGGTGNSALELFSTFQP